MMIIKYVSVRVGACGCGGCKWVRVCAVGASGCKWVRMGKYVWVHACTCVCVCVCVVYNVM